MITSLITGGAGFIGSHVAKQCLLQGHEVIVLDDLSGGFRQNVPDGAIFIEGSINSYDLLTEIFEIYQIDYVYHLAAYAAEGLSHFIRHFNYQNNLIGSVNLINLAILKEVKCFVFTSSIAVYGHGQVPMRENMSPNPEDPYGIAKYAVELDLAAAKKHFGLDYIIFRPHNVYGENQNIGDKYRNVIGIFMNQIMSNQKMTIFGDGEQTRAFTYIDDVAPIIAQSPLIKHAYNEAFNIGSDIPYSLNKLAQLIAREFHIVPRIEHLDQRNEVVHAYSDHSKAAKTFNIYKYISLEEGIHRMTNWAKVFGARKSNTFQSIEIRNKLPSVWNI